MDLGRIQRQCFGRNDEVTLSLVNRCGPSKSGPLGTSYSMVGAEGLVKKELT